MEYINQNHNSLTYNVYGDFDYLGFSEPIKTTVENFTFVVTII